MEEIKSINTGRVIDVFSYNGEADLLELRLKALDSIVDEFVICEARTTFGGNLKFLYYEQQKERFKPWIHKIKYHIIEDEYTSDEIEAARTSPHTNGEVRWIHEYLQKESIKKAITHLLDDDILYIGDVDELWEHRIPNGIEKLKLYVYTYYLNMQSTEEFWGPIRTTYGTVKDKCFNDIRNDIRYRTDDYQGWHFTNQGGIVAVKQKVIDQYNDIIFNKQLIGKDLDDNFGVRDFIGRDFTLIVNEDYWPQFLKDHKEEYIHLCKPVDNS